MALLPQTADAAQSAAGADGCIVLCALAGRSVARRTERSRRRLLDGAAGRRSRRADWHVTLCFLGAVERGAARALCRRAPAAVTRPLVRAALRALEYWAEARVLAATARAVPAAALAARRGAARAGAVARTLRPTRGRCGRT